MEIGNKGTSQRVPFGQPPPSENRQVVFLLVASRFSHGIATSSTVYRDTPNLWNVIPVSSKQSGACLCNIFFSIYIYVYESFNHSGWALMC